jgi:hypothetical protein
MYGWYEGSIVCYAYLEDIGRSLSTQTSCGPSNKDKTFEASRWFTRGWTLQELIAPTRVNFFDKQWQYLGSKRDLSPLLSRITSIPEDVLAEPKNRRNCSVARKMTWAAKRQTTRIEDVAYSLFGIFDVNMPLLYGEGRGAFIRLQEEILKETDDQSLLAWGINGTLDSEDFMGNGVFASSPDNFLGSEDVVPFPSKPGRQPHSMTNKGVRIELPVLITDPTGLSSFKYPFAILDCQINDDFSGAIGIPLTPTRDDSTFIRNPIEGTITWPASRFAGLKAHTIYITKNPLHALRYTNIETCIIRAASASRDGYDIFPITSPSGRWNEKTKVLHIGSTYGGFLEPDPTVIAFCNPGKESCFIVVIAPSPDSQWKMRTAIKIFAGPVGGDRTDLEKWVREGLLSGFEMGSKEDDKVVLPNASVPSGLVTISARMTREYILNQMVLVLSVYLL